MKKLFAIILILSAFAVYSQGYVVTNNSDTIRCKKIKQIKNYGLSYVVLTSNYKSKKAYAYIRCYKQGGKTYDVRYLNGVVRIVKRKV